MKTTCLAAYVLLALLGDYCMAQSRQDNYERLLVDISNYDDEELNKLIFADNTEIALQCAWERMRRNLLNNEVKKAAIERYLGFLEGRLSVPIPRSWEEAVQDIGLRGSRLSFSQIRQSPFSSTGSELDISISRGIRLTKQNTVWYLRGSGIDLPLVDFDPTTRSIQLGRASRSCRYLAVQKDGSGGALLAFSAFAPYSYPLVRMNNNGQVMWKTDVWCIPRPGDTTSFQGIVSMSTEIAVADAKVYVFGVSRKIGYIECFDLNNGSNLFRFTSFVTPN